MLLQLRSEPNSVSGSTKYRGQGDRKGRPYPIWVDLSALDKCWNPQSTSTLNSTVIGSKIKEQYVTRDGTLCSIEEKEIALRKRRSIELSTSEFGKLVRSYRKQRSWSQQQLADWWRYSREYVSQIERGVRKLDRVDQVNRLADILEIPAERLDAIGKGIPKRRGETENPPKADDLLVQALLEPAQTTVKLSWLVWHGDGDIAIIDNLDSSIARLETALGQYRGAFRKPSQQLLAYAYEMRGKISFDRLKYAEANGYFNEMLQLGEELKDPNIIALAMIHQGDILRKRGRFDLGAVKK